MKSSSFVQFLLLNGVLSSTFKVSYTSTASTPMTTMAANANFIANTTLPYLSSSSTLPAQSSTADHLIMSSSSKTSSTVASTGAIAHSSSNGMSSTVQANNQSYSTETPAATTTMRDAANTTSILNENLNSSSTISTKTTIPSVAVITNATTTSSPAASATGSSSLSVAPSNGTTVAGSASPGNTNITSVTNTSVTGENSTVSYMSTSSPNVSHNASTTSEKNASINITSIGPLATTEKQESTVSTSYSTESVSKSGFFSTTGSVPLESSSRTENSVQSTLSSSASTASTSHGSSVETTVAAADTGSKGNLAWIAAPVIVGVLLIVVIIVIVFVRKRRANKEPTYQKRGGQFSNDGVLNPSFHIDPEDSERTRPPVVRVQDFVSHVDELHRDSDYGFASEFSLLAKMSQQHVKTAAELPENRTKNRFTNILPFDHSRVHLIPIDDDEDGGSDYINASFVPGFSSRREFIAAQGPMRSTVDDFWRMIWEYNITTIVMVTNLFERGREKCAQYWPEQNDPIYYGDVQVEQISESSLNYYIIRIFSVKSDQQTRRLMQFQFLTWPDFGVPKGPDQLLSFLTQIRNSIPRDANQPILVHCSAGVGRTGTFILIDHVLHLIRHQTEIDVFGLVLDMRNNRPNMIQTEAQYIFAHECIRYAMEHGYHHGKQDFLLTSTDDLSTGNPEELYLNVNDKI